MHLTKPSCLTRSTERGFERATFSERGRHWRTLMGGRHSISNDDAIDWPSNPVGPWRVWSPLSFLFFHLQLLCRRGRNRKWGLTPRLSKGKCPSSSSPRYLHKGINVHARLVFTAEYDAALQYSISNGSGGSLWRVSTFLSQHFLGESVVRLPEVYRHSCLTQGDLELILRICLLDPSFPAFVEKVEAELRKLLEEGENNSWRQKSQVSCQALLLFYLFYFFTQTFLVGRAWRWWERVSRCAACSLKCCPWLFRGWTKEFKKAISFQSFYSEKKNIGLTQMFDRGYILWSLCSHLSAGPLPLQRAAIRLFWNGSHAATAVKFAMPVSKWSHIIKASLIKTNCSPYIYLRIHIA